MKIGNLYLGARPLLLAPMEDVTDAGFRLLCRRMGAAMVYSEFVAADALVRNVRSSLAKLAIDDAERPVAIQIYGKDPGAMADAARIVQDVAHPDVLDLNFGCPVKRVAGKGAGAGLLQNVPLMLEIAHRVVDAVSLPVTAKTRLGWDSNHILIDELAEQLQDCGIQALAIHGRTRAQMYKGDADWEPIARVKRNPRIHIPIIGNGDVSTAEQARRAFTTFGVDAVMVGRATFGQPWIFREMAAAVQELPPAVQANAASPQQPAPISPQVPSTGSQVPSINSQVAPVSSQVAPVNALSLSDIQKDMTPDWKLDVLEEQVRQSIRRIGEYRGILHIRRHLAATPLFKGIPDFRAHRIAILRAATQDELFALLEAARPLVRQFNA